MNWSEIATQIILSVLGVVISGVGVLLTYFINKYIKNDKLKTVLNSLNDLVRNSVAEVYQTYVEALKKGNMFDEKAQKEALERCLNIINTNMTKDIKEWLEANQSDIESYLKSLIEAQVALLKK